MQLILFRNQNNADELVANKRNQNLIPQKRPRRTMQQKNWDKAGKITK